MSGSNSDKEEGNLRNGTLNEIVDFNSPSIDHGRVSKLLSPQINNVPLFISITGMDKKEIRTKNVEDGERFSTNRQPVSIRKCADAKNQTEEEAMEDGQAKSEDKAAGPRMGMQAGAIEVSGTLVPQVKQINSDLNPYPNTTLSLTPIVNNVDDLNDWMSDETPISIKSDISVYTDYDNIIDLFLPVQETEEQEVDEKCGPLKKGGGQAVPSSPDVEYSVDPSVRSPGIGDHRRRDSCETTPQDDKKVRVNSDGKAVAVKKKDEVKVSNPIGALVFGESSDDENSRVDRQEFRDYHRKLPRFSNSKRQTAIIESLKNIQAKRWEKLVDEEKKELEYLAPYCHNLANAERHPEHRARQLHDDCRYLQMERDNIEFEKAWSKKKQELRAFERRGLHVDPEEYRRGAFDHKSEIRNAEPRPSSTSASPYCPWSPIIERNEVSKCEGRLKLKGMPHAMRHAIDHRRRTYVNDESPFRQRHVRMPSNGSSALESGIHSDDRFQEEKIRSVAIPNERQAEEVRDNFKTHRKLNWAASAPFEAKGKMSESTDTDKSIKTVKGRNDTPYVHNDASVPATSSQGCHSIPRFTQWSSNSLSPGVFYYRDVRTGRPLIHHPCQVENFGAIIENNNVEVMACGADLEGDKTTPLTKVTSGVQTR